MHRKQKHAIVPWDKAENFRALSVPSEFWEWIYAGRLKMVRRLLPAKYFCTLAALARSAPPHNAPYDIAPMMSACADACACCMMK